MPAPRNPPRAPNFPLAKQLRKTLIGRECLSRSHIVSPQLCTDILQRVSPYLRRNTPLDVLDLWPGPGLWSSAVNDFLQPRRHVLLEPDMSKYGPFLKPLAKSKSCYALDSLPKEPMNDWGDLFAKYLPEQGPPSGQGMDTLPKNDTLLVLASPPAQRNIKNHFTPARWWGTMMQSCLLQNQLQLYGSVRFLLWVPSSDAEDILPRYATDRRRPALMTESVALHTWEVMTPLEHYRINLKPLGIVEMNRERVLERAAAHNVSTPAGRELLPPPLAPLSDEPGRRPRPYFPRLAMDWHGTLPHIRKAADEAGKDKSPASKQKSRALTRLRTENGHALDIHTLVMKQLEIDERIHQLSRAAADPRQMSSDLAALGPEVAQMKADLASAVSAEHYRHLPHVDRCLDEWRMARDSNEFDDSPLLWERRPFEPLRGHPDEQYPGDLRTMIFFEANANPYATEKLQSMSKEQRRAIISLFDAMTLTCSTQNRLTVGELLRALLPDCSTNELVKATPSLAYYADKKIKPDSDGIALEDPTADPTRSFQENIDYDLDNIRLRCLPVSTMWDILFTCYERRSDLTAAQFGRLLGSTTTTSRTGRVEDSKLKG